MPPDVKRNWIAALNRIVVENRLKLGEIVAITATRLPFTEMCTWLRAATRIVGTHVKAVKALHELGGRQEHLRSLVRRLPALLHWEFGRRGIPARLAFVPQELRNFHANLGWEYRRLTDAQWLLLQETFVSLHVGLDSSRKYRRRKPLPADRILFEGILWKLAGGLSWQDLPDNYPVRLCQDLYWALYRTGHMQAICNQLHWHLNVYGGATLDELVERGCFGITGNRVHLSLSEDLTWEKYTALILLQQAFHARRVIRWEADLERHRRSNLYRLPAIRHPNSHPQPARSSVPGSPPNIPPLSHSSGILDRSTSPSAPLRSPSRALNYLPAPPSAVNKYTPGHPKLRSGHTVHGEMHERLTPYKPQGIKWAGFSPAHGIPANSTGLFQDDIESIGNAADTG